MSSRPTPVVAVALPRQPHRHRHVVVGRPRFACELHGSRRCSRRCSSPTQRPASAAEAIAAGGCFCSFLDRLQNFTDGDRELQRRALVVVRWRIEGHRSSHGSRCVRACSATVESASAKRLPFARAAAWAWQLSGASTSPPTCLHPARRRSLAGHQAARVARLGAESVGGVAGARSLGMLESGDQPTLRPRRRR